MSQKISNIDRRNSFGGNKKDAKDVKKLMRHMSIENIQQMQHLHHQWQEHIKVQDQRDQETYEQKQEVLVLRRRIQELENQINDPQSKK